MANDELDMFLKMSKFLAILWTFVLLHFHQFSSNLQNGDKLCNKYK